MLRVAPPPKVGLLALAIFIAPTVQAGPPEARGIALETTPRPEPVDTEAFRFAHDRYARRIALTIGINKYSGRPWGPLRAAVSDAARMANLLKEMGFETVRTVQDESATRSALLNLLEVEIPKLAGPNDLVVVFLRATGIRRAAAASLYPLMGGEIPSAPRYPYSDLRRSHSA